VLELKREILCFLLGFLSFTLLVISVEAKIDMYEFFTIDDYSTEVTGMDDFALPYVGPAEEQGESIAVEIAPGRGVFAIYDTATGLWSDEAYPLGDPRINPDKVISIEEWKENTTSSLD